MLHVLQLYTLRHCSRMPKEVLLEKVLLEKQAPEAGHVRGLAEVGAIDCVIVIDADVTVPYRTTHSCVTYVTRHEPFCLATCFEERCHSTISFGSGGGFRWATPAQPGVGRQPQAPI